MTEPNHEFMRRGTLVRWLQSAGISESSMDSMIEAGAIVPMTFPGNKKHHFSRSQVRKALFSSEAVPAAEPHAAKPKT